MTERDAPGAGFDLERPRRIHIVGIGGAGMSAIAILLVSLGHHVTGSDFKASRFTAALEALGVRVFLGHKTQNIGGADVLAISSAVRDTNAEVRAAREAGIPVLRRVDILSLLTHRWRTIAVAGTHGKTTTASILTTVLATAGYDPSYIVGAQLNDSGANAHRGSGEYLVCEADESDRTFLSLGAYAAIVTNVEADHLENYGSLDALEEAFHAFVAGIPGPRVVGLDDPGCKRVTQDVDVVGYGFADDCRYQAVDVELVRGGARYTVVVDGVSRGRLRLPAPGRHNVANSLAALACAVEIGVPVEAAMAGVGRFRGVARRFESRGEVKGITLVDDYAHLPTEVAAALDAARSGGWRRVVAVFQPHLYSRTRDFAGQFGEALSLADVAFVTDVFPAREDPIPGVTGALVAAAVTASGGRSVYVPHRGEVARLVATELEPGDICMSIGAGDITSLADELASELPSPTQGRVEAAASELRDVLELPPQRDMPVAPLTTYRVGGTAAIFVEPSNEEELIAIRKIVRRYRLPVLMIGRGSNMLVSDSGFPGVVVRLGAGFNWIDVDGATVRAGSATPLAYLARTTGRAGLTGLEFGVGIPASVGGAVRMNAGGHGSEIVEVLDAVGVVDLDGDTDAGVEERRADSLDMSYRHTNLLPGDVVVWARFRLVPGDRDRSEADMNEIVRWRKENQPAGPSAGSTFTNPPGDSAGRLIDTAGCKGLRVGGAYVSQKHANFIMAEPWGRAADVYAVIRAVQRRVIETHGVELKTEVRMIGDFGGESDAGDTSAPPFPEAT